MTEKVKKNTIPIRGKKSRDVAEREKAEYAKKIVKITIPWCPPTANQWERMHWAKRTRLKNQAYAYLKAHYQDLAIPVPCTIITEVFKRNPGRGDAHNLTTPVDKLFLDCLTSPRGRKTRGLGLLPDDSPQYCVLTTPSIRLSKTGEERTVMRFEPMKKRLKYG